MSATAWLESGRRLHEADSITVHPVIAAKQAAWPSPTNSTNFAANGAPIAEKATVTELALPTRLVPALLLELSYSEQFDSENHEQDTDARWSIHF